MLQKKGYHFFLRYHIYGQPKGKYYNAHLHLQKNVLNLLGPE